MISLGVLFIPNRVLLNVTKYPNTCTDVSNKILGVGDVLQARTARRLLLLRGMSIAHDYISVLPPVRDVGRCLYTDLQTSLHIFCHIFCHFLKVMTFAKDVMFNPLSVCLLVTLRKSY